MSCSWFLLKPRHEIIREIKLVGDISVEIEEEELQVKLDPTDFDVVMEEPQEIAVMIDENSEIEVCVEENGDICVTLEN